MKDKRLSEQLTDGLVEQLVRGKPLVLVVDDDPDVRVWIVRILLLHGYFVSESCDGRSALAEIERNMPSLVLLDLRMPGLDGFDFIKSASVRWPKLPIVLMTGYADSSYIKSRIGTVHHLEMMEKPFDAQRLLSVLKKHKL